MRKILLLPLAALSVLVVSCQNYEPVAPREAISPEAPTASASPAGATNPTPTPTPIASPTVVAPIIVQTDSSPEEIDRYLTWFIGFAQKRAGANAEANKHLRELAKQTTGGREERLALMDQTVALNKKLADEFLQEKVPAECAELARLYATMLTKSIIVMEALVASSAGEISEQDTFADLSTSDAVRDELEQVNQEIERLYKKYPQLKTPKLQLT